MEGINLYAVVVIVLAINYKLRMRVYYAIGWGEWTTNSCLFYSCNTARLHLLPYLNSVTLAIMIATVVGLYSWS